MYVAITHRVTSTKITINCLFGRDKLDRKNISLSLILNVVSD